MNRVMRLLLLLMPLGSTPGLAATPDRSPLVQPFTPESGVGSREAAERYLRHLYAVYLSVRACEQTSGKENKPELMPSVSLEEARRIMRLVEAASTELRIDVDRVWAEISPVGLITAESLRTQSLNTQAELCGQIGGVFRIDLGNLQNVLTHLGSKRSIIEKDF